MQLSVAVSSMESTHIIFFFQLVQTKLAAGTLQNKACGLLYYLKHTHVCVYCCVKENVIECLKYIYCIQFDEHCDLTKQKERHVCVCVYVWGAGWAMQHIANNCMINHIIYGCGITATTCGVNLSIQDIPNFEQIELFKWIIVTG